MTTRAERLQPDQQNIDSPEIPIELYPALLLFYAEDLSLGRQQIASLGRFNFYNRPNEEGHLLVFLRDDQAKKNVPLMSVILSENLGEEIQFEYFQYYPDVFFYAQKKLPKGEAPQLYIDIEPSEIKSQPEVFSKALEAMTLQWEWEPL